MDFEKLQEPFRASDIEWRIQEAKQNSGKKPWARVLAYVTSRAVMDRLDEVCGPDKWATEFASGPDGGVTCGISIKVGEEWVTKWDGAANTKIEPVKGGLSGAMKRAAVHWGIGRYLYQMDAGFAIICDGGVERGKFSDTQTWFRWNPPFLPSWALPGGEGKPPASDRVRVTDPAPEGMELGDKDTGSKEDSDSTIKLKDAVRKCDTEAELKTLWAELSPVDRMTIRDVFMVRRGEVEATDG